MADGFLDVGDGARLRYHRTESGEPLLLATGTAAASGMWMPVEPALAERYDLVSFDYRGLGESTRGDGAITAASLAGDVRTLLDALDISRAHVLGWSLGSAVAQELALASPDRVASLVLYGTWARVDPFMTALLTALKYPWETGDVATALVTLGVVYSPEFLESPEFEKFVAWTAPLAPSTPEQVKTVAEQWGADLAFDSLDRIGAIMAPTLVLTGEADLVTPRATGAPWPTASPARRSS